jgi:outer membrane receptor protein involved in Fe transport
MLFTRIIKGVALFICAVFIAAAPAPAVQGNEAGAGESADKKQFQLETIVVVGDKVGRDLQQLPISTSVISAQRIENEPIEDIEDVFNRMANVTNGTNQYGSFSIRGVNNNALSASYNQTNSLATVFINQVPLGSYTSDFLKPSAWDVASVEVLRGPQSTMQGPNSLIGAAFINYKRPDFSYDGKVRGEYGKYQTWNAAVYQNVPIVNDMLAARISSEIRRSDGAVESTVDGSDDVAGIDERMIRGQVLFQPFKNKNINFNLTGMYNKSTSNPFPYVTSANLEDRKNSFDTKDEYPSEVGLLSLESEIRINERWKILTVTGYSNLDVDMKYDADFTSMPIMVANAKLKEEAFNQDLRLKFTSQQLRSSLGAYYSNSKAISLYTAEGLAGSFLPSSAWDIEEKTTTAAAYINVDYDILPRLTINAGLRYNYEDRESSNTSDAGGMAASLDGKEQFTQLLPSISLTYRFTDDINAGAKYSRGYRSGGVSTAPFAHVAKPYDEEFTDNYEVFFRSRFLDNRLIINSNIYYTKWHDMQVPVMLEGGIPGYDNIIENAGEVELKGFELEGTFKLITGLTCFASLGYAHTEFKDFVANQVDHAGQSLPNAPEWTVSLGANYRHPSGFFGGANYRWADKAYSDVSSPDNTRLSGRSILDAKIGYRAKCWAAYAWGTNLLDDDYELALIDMSPYGMGTVGFMGTPRMVGLGAEIYW